MKIHELDTAPRPSRKRVGRGIAAGQGKTAGRGTKGQNARTGKKLKATFMGGQGPLAQRTPKLRGFKSLRVPAQVVYTGQLDSLTAKSVDNAGFAEAGLVATPYHSIKIIVKGDVTKPLAIKAQGASQAAIDAIAKAGGSFEKIDVPLKVSTKPAKDQTE